MPSMGSMGSVGDATTTPWPRAEARMAFEWIEGWYNPQRRHSSLGYLSPNNFERSMSQENRKMGYQPVHRSGSRALPGPGSV